MAGRSSLGTGALQLSRWVCSLLKAVPAAWAIVALTSWRLGVDVAAIDPVSTITRLGDRPVLLIHGTADAIDLLEQSREARLHAALAAGVPAQLGTASAEPTAA